MGQSYFIWNNQDCRGMGVILRGPAAIIRPEERVQHVTIPGMAGDLTLTEGEYRSDGQGDRTHLHATRF